MSESLLGGLLPLGKRSDPGSGSASNLSGGLIPLGKGTESGATFGQVDKGSKSIEFGKSWGDGQAADFEDRESAGKPKSRRGGKMGKPRSSRKGDTHSQKWGGGVADTIQAGKERAGSGDEAEGNFFKDPPEDDSYLFMGATAGTKLSKEKKASGGTAEAAALLLGSDDFFGLPKPSSTGRGLELVSGTSIPQESISKENIDDSGIYNARSKGEQQSRLFPRKSDQHASRRKDTGEVSVGDVTSSRETGAAEGDIDVDFDSPDGADALLRLTDPAVLDGSRTTMPQPGHVDTNSSERNAPEEYSGLGRREGIQRPLSPSPPSSPRRTHSDTGDLTSHRFRAGRGLLQQSTLKHTPEDLKEGEGGGNSPGRVVATGLLDGPMISSHGGGKPLSEQKDNDGTMASAVGAVESEPARFLVNDSHDQPVEAIEKGLLSADNTYSVLSRDVSGGITAKPSAGASRVRRRSELSSEGNPPSKGMKPLGVTFDDDVRGLDALDILPSSSDDDKKAPAAAAADASVTTSPKSFAVRRSSLGVGVVPVNPTVTQKGIEGAHGLGSSHDTTYNSYLPVSEPASMGSRRKERSRSTPITEGLSPAAYRLLAEDSLSDERTPSKNAGDGRLRSRQDLVSPTESKAVGKTSSFGLDIMPSAVVSEVSVDDAKLDLALGFTPSAMSGARRPRRSLPSGGRRRARAGISPAVVKAQLDPAGGDVAAAESVAMGAGNVTQTAVIGLDKLFGIGGHDRDGKGITQDKISDDVEGVESPRQEQHPSRSVASIVDAQPTSKPREPGPGSAEGATSTAKEVPRGTESVQSSSAASLRTPATIRARFEMQNDRGVTQEDASNAGSNAVSIKAPVVASLERQLVLLAGEREAAAAKFIRKEERLQREADTAREALTAAEARAGEAEAALAAARARIGQLEAASVEHAVSVAALESRAASDLRAEHEACLAKISDSDCRHQEDLRRAEKKHEEALSELKRLHREELEDLRRRNADSRTLETLAGQVHASAGAVKLLQAELLERKGASEVVREGQMDARERLVKELEHSARRAQKTAEDEVQRLQGALMAMDQVMRGLRGQNSGERERLRQEHLRMEALQASMVAEVEAARRSVDEERQRLSERFGALERDKREQQAANRVESDRLAEERAKLEADRRSFSELQVASAEATEVMARRKAVEEDRLRMAKESLAREASSLEARLVAARAELLKADDVRSSLARLREQDELKRRRLGVVAGELERALEEVQARSAECEESRLQAERARAEAWEESERITQERESLRRRSVQVEQEERRQDADRTSIAQARAQSATELSTSRRLKSDLARAFAAGQRRSKMLYDVKSALSPNSTPPCVCHVGGDTAMRTYTLPRREMMTVTPGGGGGWKQSNHASPPDTAGGIPHTGIAAAEATLQAMSSEPSLLGKYLARDMWRLERRAADLRECTREQGAFLASSRSTGGLGSVLITDGSLGLEMDMSMHLSGSGLPQRNTGFRETRENIATEEFLRAADENFVGLIGQSTTSEDIKGMESACLQRLEEMKDVEMFMNEIGKVGTGSVHLSK